MSRLISSASVWLLAGLVSAALLSAQEVPPKVEEKKPVEGAPAKAKYVPPASIQLDPAKTQRLAKLLENLYVLNELNVSDEVYDRLKDVQAASRVLSEELSKELSASRNLPAAERAERTRNFFPAYQARKTAVEESLAFQRFGLLTGPQLQRLEQIDFQDQGLDVFLADDVVKGLKLTPEERKKLDEIYDTYVTKIKPLLRSALIRSRRPSARRSLRSWRSSRSGMPKRTSCWGRSARRRSQSCAASPSMFRGWA